MEARDLVLEVGKLMREVEAGNPVMKAGNLLAEVGEEAGDPGMEAGAEVGNLVEVGVEAEARNL